MHPLLCPKCEKTTPHSFVEEKGEYNEIYMVKCAECHANHDIERKLWLSHTAGVHGSGKTSKAYLTKYPRIEPQTGQVVKSREHMYDTARAAGMHWKKFEN